MFLRIWKTLPPRSPTPPSPPHLHACLTEAWHRPWRCTDLRGVVIPKKHFHPSEAFLTGIHLITPQPRRLRNSAQIWRLSHSLSHLLTTLRTPPALPGQNVLLRKAGEQAEVPAGKFCTDPPSCKPKWKARMLPKTASEKKGLTWAVVKATLELHRCSNSFYLVNITSTAQEEAHERRCLFCN